MVKNPPSRRIFCCTVVDIQVLPTVYIFCYLPAVPLWCRKPQHAVAEVSCFFGFYHGEKSTVGFSV